MGDLEFAELIQSRQNQVDALGDLDEAAKAKVKDFYKQAAAEMEAVKKWAESTVRYEKLASDAPGELGRIQNELAALPAQPAAIPADASLVQIEQIVADEEAELQRLRKALDDDEAVLKGGAGRRAKIADQIDAAQARLAEVQKRIAPPAADGESPAVYAAEQTLFEAQRRSAEREIACCNAELKAQTARAELLPLQRDFDARQVALKEQKIKSAQESANRQRKREAEHQALQASREADQALPGVEELLKTNTQLADKRRELADSIAVCSERLDYVNRQLATLTKQFTSDQEKVDTVGLTNEIGDALKQHREALSDFRDCCRNVVAREKAIGQGLLDQLEYNEQRASLYDLEARTQIELEKLGPTLPNQDRGRLQKAIYDALKARYDYLNALIGDLDVYYEKLVKLKDAEQKLVKTAGDYARFIDERVLWIASSDVLGADDLQHLGDAAWWLVGPEAWLAAGRTLTGDLRRQWALWLLIASSFSLLVLRRRRMRERIEEIGQQTVRGSCYRFLPTMEAAGLTVLLSAAWPGLMGFVGWRLMAGDDASVALGHGLFETAQVFFALELLRNVCRRGGLGESHFHWPVSAMNVVRQNVKRLTLPALPLMYVAVAMAWCGRNAWDASLGRIAFMVALTCFSFALHRIFRPESVVSRTIIAARPGGWVDRLRYVWYPLVVTAPLVLAILAGVGYHYTARQLVVRLILTAYVLVGSIVFRALLLRWTLVNQRKLAIEQARQRRAAAQVENASCDDELAELPATASPERDLASINIQTRRLIDYALAVACALMLWCAWSDVLPALNILNRVQIWPTFQLQDDAVAASDTLTLTLANVVFALLTLATTVIAAKNIPGLLEMAVLQHLPVDAGARYAVVTLCRYLISLVGLATCFGTLGVGWGQVQLLVAAMGLGLGIGLQEIFANFVSGLIILIERPIRVGDIVTVDQISGIVSCIRMRATTITDWDRKELVIPNKEFITGRVLNWTLSDPVNRVVVNVGVAYGSDTQKATDLLMKIAQEHPVVMADPPPRVTLEAFGASSLDFVLRCYLPNLENRLATIHELHMSIDQAFRDAGIEIAFPQQDVHVRSIEMPHAVVQAAMAAGKSRGMSERAA